MHIEQLDIEGFRNFKSVAVRCHTGVNIIYGDNAQGKTNLIEAIWSLSGVRSFRKASDSDMMGKGAKCTVISADFYSGGRSQTAKLELYPKKRAFKNDILLPSARKLTGNVLIVVFAPGHLSLIKDGPLERREFIDNTICQLKPQYEKVLLDFSRVLYQRGMLLKAICRGRAGTDTLDAWDDHFIRLSTIIMRTRQTYLELLEEPATRFYAGISGGTEQFAFSYRPSIPVNTGVENYKELVAEAVRAARPEDIKQGSSTVGAHRDDIYFEIDGLSARTHCSQGQQRSAVLALKLAECEAIRSYSGEQPIVLLDDVMSELDLKRRKYLLESIKDRQMFITCCEKELFAGSRDAKLFYIENGEIFEDSDIRPQPDGTSS